MASAYKCDICGRLYEAIRTSRIGLWKYPEYLNDKVSRYDICPTCEKAFHQWVVSRKPNERTAFEDKEDA